MAIILSRERIRDIDELLSYEMDDWGRYKHTNNEIFDQLSDFAEMHYFVSNFSGEKDHTVPLLIIDDKRCDKATALLMFWRVCPRFYTVFSNEEEAKSSHADFIFLLLKKILSNWESGFYSHQQLAFDPCSISSYEVNTPEPNEKWSIPEYMKEALAGEEVIAEK